MADIRLVDSVKNAMLTALRDAFDVGNSAAVFDFYTSPRPTLPSSAATGTLLGTVTFPDPSCATVGTPTAGRMTVTPGAMVSESSADATGTAFYARVSSVNSGVKTTVGDFDVGVTGGGAAVQMNTTNIVIGGPIIITAFEVYL